MDQWDVEILDAAHSGDWKKVWIMWGSFARINESVDYKRRLHNELIEIWEEQ